MYRSGQPYPYAWPAVCFRYRAVRACKAWELRMRDVVPLLDIYPEIQVCSGAGGLGSALRPAGQQSCSSWRPGQRPAPRWAATLQQLEAWAAPCAPLGSNLAPERVCGRAAAARVLQSHAGLGQEGGGRWWVRAPQRCCGRWRLSTTLDACAGGTHTWMCRHVPTLGAGGRHVLREAPAPPLPCAARSQGRRMPAHPGVPLPWVRPSQCRRMPAHPGVPLPCPVRRAAGADAAVPARPAVP